MSTLGALKGGITLKKAAPVVKRVDPKMSLLASIKTGGGGLKHVERKGSGGIKNSAGSDAPTLGKETSTGGGSTGMFGAATGINAILERRKFLVEDDSDDDDSDDDWD